MAKIVILGAGVMGSAMSLPASAKGHSVDLVGTFLDTDSVRSVQGNGLHPRLGITLPETVAAYEWTDFGNRLDDETALIILGVSSAGLVGDRATGWGAHPANSGSDDHEGVIARERKDRGFPEYCRTRTRGKAQFSCACAGRRRTLHCRRTCCGP